VKPVHQLADEMIMVHNVLLRAINAVYLQCINVESSPNAAADTRDLARYAKLWCDTVHIHHAGEEKMTFPEIGQLTGVKGIMDDNIEQHRQFHEGLDRMEAYLASVEKGEAAYEGQKLRAIIDSFMPVLAKHLHEEIGTLLALDKYEDKTDWHKWHASLNQRIMKEASGPDIKYEGLPLVMTAQDKTFEDGAYANDPPLPWFVFLLFKWVWAPKNAQCWRFAPCDVNGKPRELPFA
jgi:hemerythrin-like domain-containing protein